MEQQVSNMLNVLPTEMQSLWDKKQVVLEVEEQLENFFYQCSTVSKVISVQNE